MERSCVLLVGNTPLFVHTIVRILTEHGYGVLVRAWTDDLRTAVIDRPLAMVTHAAEITTVEWSLLTWLEHDPIARCIPVLICSDNLPLLPYAVRALHHHLGPVVASSLDRDEFLAKLSGIQAFNAPLERTR